MLPSLLPNNYLVSRPYRGPLNLEPVTGRTLFFDNDSSRRRPFPDLVWVAKDVSVIRDNFRDDAG